jgi:hypothetical protein
VQREEMNFVIILKGAQLTSRHDADAEAIAGGARRVNPGNAVVIGEGDRRQVAPLCGFYYALGRKCTVGGS